MITMKFLKHINFRLNMFLAKRALRKLGLSERQVQEWEYFTLLKQTKPNHLQVNQAYIIDQRDFNNLMEKNFKTISNLKQNLSHTTITLDKKTEVVKPKQQKEDWITDTIKEEPEDLIEDK